MRAAPESLTRLGSKPIAKAADDVRHAPRPPRREPQQPVLRREDPERGIGIRFKGVEKTNVEEYCVSEGWVRLSAGKTLDRAGNPMTVKLKGPVEPYFRDDVPAEG